MADGAHKDVLGQKAQAAQRAFEARGMSPAKALRRALSRTADVNWDLALVPQEVAIDALSQDGVVAMLKPSDLLLVMDGPEGRIGLVAVEREVMTGVIEVQTIQQVTQLPVDADRVLTATDAAMMTPLVDGTMDRLAQLLDDHPYSAQARGFRFGAMLEDARAAGLLLDASGYRMFRADMDIALGRRRGAISFFLPDLPKPQASQRCADNALGPHAEELSRVEARLDAVLAHLSMPLNKAQKLQPGDLVPLPQGALDKVELVAGSGRKVVAGRLGQYNGMRAVRVMMPVGASPSGETEDPADLSTTNLGSEHEPPAALTGMELPDPEPSPDMPAEEELPDLPPIDFAAEAGEFDMDFTNEGAFDFDPDAPGQTADGDAPALDNTDFSAAPVEFDFEE